MAISKILKQKVFQYAAGNFETEDIKAYFISMAEHVPDYFFTMPASTSGKYHSEQQCRAGGQLIHAFMFQSCLEHLIALERNRSNFASDPHTRDLMRCVPLFHDAYKCGTANSKYTVPDHPVIAAAWVRNTKPAHDISLYDKEIIAGMCEAHSGEWNTDRSKKEIMPKPRNDMEFLIHECDILSSRKDLTYDVPEELQSILNEVTETPYIADNKTSVRTTSSTSPEQFVMPFGRYKGLTLEDISRDADGRSYIVWAAANIRMESVANATREYLRIRKAV